MDIRRRDASIASRYQLRELLGWDDAKSGTIGFQIPTPSEPITYSGPGHRMTLGGTGSGKAVNEAVRELLSFAGDHVSWIFPAQCPVTQFGER